MNSKDEVIKLRNEGKSYDEIKEELNISKSTISYHCKRYGLNNIGKSKVINSELKKKIIEYCKNHTIKETSKEFDVSISTVKRYKNKKYKVLSDHQKKEKNVKSVIEWRRRVKVKLVNYKGGKCEICGYNKCISSMDFHHLDPSEKDFSISSKTLSFDRLKNEVDKCILVCRNCHGEIHYEIEEDKRKSRMLL